MENSIRKKHIFLQRSSPYKNKLGNCLHICKRCADAPWGYVSFLEKKKSIAVKHRSLFQASARNYNALTSLFFSSPGRIVLNPGSTHWTFNSSCRALSISHGSSLQSPSANWFCPVLTNEHYILHVHSHYILHFLIVSVSHVWSQCFGCWCNREI